MRSTDFIQQYIFPGGLLPSDHEFRLAAGRAGLEVERTLAFGADYAETLHALARDFCALAERSARWASTCRFVRLWDFYLSPTAKAAFDTGRPTSCGSPGAAATTRRGVWRGPAG